MASSAYLDVRNAIADEGSDARVEVKWVESTFVFFAYAFLFNTYLRTSFSQPQPKTQ